MSPVATWTWALIALLILAVLVPLLLAVLRPARARGRREADLALYRAQMAELERERASGRLDEAAHRAAMLEVQRRLLAAPGAAAEAPDVVQAGPPAGQARMVVLAAVVLVPAFAIGIYRLQGVPDMPSAPYEERRAAAERDDAVLATLRQRLEQLDPRSEPAQRGYALLGNAERGRGRPDLAAEAYRRSLAAGFDAEIAAQLVQVLLEAEKTEEARAFLAEALPRAPTSIGLRFLSGLAEARAGRPEAARTAWRALIADAPADAPWKAMVERRMAELP